MGSLPDGYRNRKNHPWLAGLSVMNSLVVQPSGTVRLTGRARTDAPGFICPSASLTRLQSGSGTMVIRRINAVGTVLWP